MKILFKIGLLLFVCFMLSGCPGEFEVVTCKIVNNSDKNILWSMAGYGRDLSEYERNPWIVGRENMEDVKRKRYYIKAGGFYEYPLSVFKEDLARFSAKYYIFDCDSLCAIPWERIRDERIILKEVVFSTWEDMEASNFTITYP